MRDNPNQRLMVKCLTIIQIELEFVNAVFLRPGESQSTRIKPLGARKKTNNKFNPHMTPGPRIEPGAHSWEESALTTASAIPAPPEQYAFIFFSNSCHGVFTDRSIFSLNLSRIQIPTETSITNCNDVHGRTNVHMSIYVLSLPKYAQVDWNGLFRGKNI